MNYYVFSVHRGGSCVLGDISKYCFEKNNISTNIIGSDDFEEVSEEGCARKVGGGINPVYEPILKNWQKRHGLFSPIRRPDYFPRQLFNEHDKYLINIRDPRDCMVSGYYGFLKLHGKGLDNPENLKKYNKGIDLYVIEDLLLMYKQNYNEYIKMIDEVDGFKVIKYEDMVTDFTEWFSSFYSYFGLSAAHYAECHDHCKPFFDPVSEDENKHKRQMMPGDYKRRLTSKSIDLINTELEEILTYFDYN